MKNTMISFIGIDNKLILKTKITGIPLKDDFIIKKSIEFFNDPEPCMIHRSAVMKRIYMEFFDYFKGLIGAGKDQDQVLWDDLPLLVRESVDLPGKPYLVTVYHTNK